MNCLFKICVSVMILSIINLQVPVLALAAGATVTDQSSGITKNEPEMLATPEVRMPGAKSYTWLWVVLGAVAIGGAAAVGAAGGHSSSSGGNSNAGSLQLSW